MKQLMVLGLLQAAILLTGCSVEFGRRGEPAGFFSEEYFKMDAAGGNVTSVLEDGNSCMVYRVDEIIYDGEEPVSRTETEVRPDEDGVITGEWFEVKHLMGNSRLSVSISPNTASTTRELVLIIEVDEEYLTAITILQSGRK